MPTVTPISETLAKAALTAIEEQFEPFITACDGTSRPTLHGPGHEGDHWVISWEEGPHEWAMRAFTGGIDDEVMAHARAVGVDHANALKIAQDPAKACPAGVFAEPIMTFILGLYPE